MNRIKMFTRFCKTLTVGNKIVVEHLNHRGIVRVNGPDVEQFMQGLITNDMKHLVEGHSSSMYTMFLNTRGRVLHDGLIYRTLVPNTYFIECDSESAVALQKHLRMYRIRRKVDVDSLGQEYKIWVVFDKATEAYNELSKSLSAIRDQFVCPCGDPSKTTVESHDFQLYRDPRLGALGLRFVTNKDYKSQDVAKILGLEDVNENNSDSNYRSYRYKLGIGEGQQDLPPESCFPLEANGDYLHAVSFNKGCYLGQELTARTYHTGVIRKRLMPLYLETKLPETNESVPVDISNEAKAKVGKLRGVDGTTGLALLRIAPALAAQQLNVFGVPSRTEKPHWWPTDTNRDA